MSDFESEPLVSVIIPTYNRAYCVAATIDSALAQTHRNLEILVIDDGSKDDTGALIAKRYGNEPRVKYHYKKNGGAASAKNHGLSLVTGDYVAILDSDDLWFPWKVELQVAWMRQNPDVGMTWTDMEAMDPQGKITDPAYLRKMYHNWRRYSTDQLFGKGTKISELAEKQGGALKDEIAAARLNGEALCYRGSVFSQMIMGCLVHTSTVLLTRERALQVKEWDEAFTPIGEDYDFYLRASHKGPVGFIDVPSIRYQTGNPDQLTAPRLHVLTAVNCLRTIEPWIVSGKDIDLPRSVQNRRLSDVHMWVAGAMLVSGDNAGCRKHVIKGMKQYPWRIMGWRLLAAGCVPPKLMKGVRRMRAWRKMAAVLLAVHAVQAIYDAGADVLAEYM